MVYTPQKYITISNARLTESTDLSVLVSSLVGSESYLVVTQNNFEFTIPIGGILTFVPGIDLSKPLSTAFSSLLTDAFIAQFQMSGIPTTNRFGEYDNRLKVFNPISYKDYVVHFTSVNTPDIVDDGNRKGILDDLAIVSSDDMSNCLVAVNGVFHKTTYTNNTLYVYDGFRTIRLSGRRDIVIVDTTNVGGHTVIPLTATNVSKPAYQQNAVVSLDQSIVGKTLFAVIDGYFYHRDQDVLKIADATHLKIRTNLLPLVQQFRHNPRTIYRRDRYGAADSQESTKYTDSYDSLFFQNRSVPSSTLETADFQYSRLTAYHSFIVVMNNPNLYTTTGDIFPTGTPQLYENLSNRTISGMMSYGCGLCPSYLIWKDPFKRKFVFIQNQDYDLDRQNDSLNSAFVPSLFQEIEDGVKTQAKFIDYVSA